MSLWSVLQGVYHQVNPFDNGATYGTYNPPKRKLNQNQPQPLTPQLAPQPNIQPVNPNNAIKTLSFGTLQPSNRVQVPTQYNTGGLSVNNQSNTQQLVVSNPPPPVTPITVARPSMPTPNISVPTNTGVGPAALNTSWSTPPTPKGSALDYATGGTLGALGSLARLGFGTLALGGRINPLHKTFDAQSNNPVSNTVGAIENIDNPNAPGSLMNQIPTSNANTGQRVGSDVINAAALLTGLRSIPDIVRNIPKGVAAVKNVPNLIRGIHSAEEIAPAVTHIPVTVANDIPVSSPESPAQPVNVRTVPKTLIKEVGGDANTAQEAAQKLAATKQQQLEDRFDSQRTTPDQNVEGVTPQKSTPFQLSPAEVAANQQKIIDDYAGMLKDVGQGNGTQLVPDGEGGYIRTSDNYRPDMGTKAVSNAGWQAEAESQLRSGKAESSTQQAFNDASNPETQSLINRGEQTPAPEGRPITVKQVNPISVVDKTEIPANLPPTPGKVRVSKATAPVKAEEQAIAAKMPTSAPVSAVGKNVEPNVAPVATTTEEMPATPTETPKMEKFQNAVLSKSKNQAFKDALKEDVPTKDYPSLAELHDNAVATVGSKSLPELIRDYGGKDAVAGNAAQAQEFLHATRVLEAAPETPQTAEAAANALNAYKDFGSKAGYGTRSMALAYKDMPATMKTNYLAKLVQKAGGDLPPGEFAALNRETVVQTDLAKTAEEADGKVNELSANYAKDSFDGKEMGQALQTQSDAHDALYKQNEVILSMLKQHLPPSSIADRVVANARTMMLSSVGGRAFAMQSTLGANLPAYLSDKTTSAVAGKVINLIKGDNGVKSSLPNVRRVFTGAKQGFKDLNTETFGKAPVKSVDNALKSPYDNTYSHDSTRYGKFGSHPVVAVPRKVVRAMVGSHLAATSGVKDIEIEQAARQAATDMNLPKSQMKSWIDYYKANAPAKVEEEANQAKLAVNNLHKNGVSDVLKSINAGIDKIGEKSPGAAVLAKTIKTVFMPFPSYAGGLINKTFTDRNLFYNVYRMTRARSAQEFADQLGHAATNTVTAGAIGYMLAKEGIITNKDQDGNNYDGFYFHVGNKYVSGGIAGQLVAPIVLGSELYNSTHNGGGVGGFAKNLIEHTMLASGAASTFGAYNPFSVATGSGGSGIVPSIIKGSGSAVLQHVPGWFGDVNALLNQTGLNSTHEQAQTKATSLNLKTGNQDTNYVGTEVNKFKNTIPEVSQGLPRQAGEAAPTEFDRMEHAGETSPAQQVQENAVKTPNTIHQLPNGQYSYSIDGAPAKMAKTQYLAQTAIDKAAYDKSGQTAPTVINGNVFTKDPQTDTITVQTKSKYDYKQLTDAYSVNSSNLSDLKSQDDLTGWMSTAQSQLQNIQAQLKDSNTTSVQAAQLKSAEQTLVNEMATYKGYGGFTKGSSGAKGSTTFGTLSNSNNPFAPTAKSYQTASFASGGIPVIKAVQPNIVHKISVAKNG